MKHKNASNQAKVDRPKSRKMECALSFLDRDGKSLPEDIQTAVIGQLEVVDTGHNTGKIVVGRVRMFAGTADNRENRCQTLEAYRRR